MYYVFKKPNLLSDDQNRSKDRKNVTAGYLRMFLNWQNHAKELAIKRLVSRPSCFARTNKEKRKGDIRNSQSVIRRPWLRMKRHLAQGRSCISCTFVSFSLRAAHVRQKRARFYLTFHDDFIVARFRASFLRFPARNLSASIETRVTSLINVKLRFHWRDASHADATTFVESSNSVSLFSNHAHRRMSSLRT